MVFTEVDEEGYKYYRGVRDPILYTYIEWKLGNFALILCECMLSKRIVYLPDIDYFST